MTSTLIRFLFFFYSLCFYMTLFDCIMFFVPKSLAFTTQTNVTMEYPFSLYTEILTIVKNHFGFACQPMYLPVEAIYM